MKKVLKHVLLSVTVLVMAFSAVSCGRVRSGKDITDAEKLSAYKTYNTVTKVDLGDFSPVKEVGDYLLLYKNDSTAEKPHVYALYDVKKGEIFGEEARTLTPTTPFADYRLLDKTLIIDTSTSTDSKATVYYEGNSVVVSGDVSVRTSTFPTGALVSVGDHVFYKNTDGNLTYTLNSNVTASEIVGGANGYYFSIDANSNNILIFDSNFNLYGRVVVPSYAVEKSVFALSNGNVLVQYCYRADEYSDDYDYMDETGGKFNIKTLIYEAEKNADREIKFEYKCSSAVTGLQMLSDKVTNLITVYKINDRRIDLNNSEKLTVALSDAGRVLTTFEKASPLLSSAVILPEIGGLYRGVNVEGRSMLFDNKLNVLGTFDILYNFSWGYVGDGVAYDLSGNVIKDLEKEDFTICAVKDDCLILRADTTAEKTYQGDTLPSTVTTSEYYYFKEKELTKLASTTDDKEVATVSVIKGDTSWSDKGSFLVEEQSAESKSICKIMVYSASGKALFEKRVDLSKEHGEQILSATVIPLYKTNSSLVSVKMNEWNNEDNEYQQKMEYYLLENA